MILLRKNYSSIIQRYSWLESLNRNIFGSFTSLAFFVISVIGMHFIRFNNYDGAIRAFLRILFLLVVCVSAICLIVLIYYFFYFLHIFPQIIYDHDFKLLASIRYTRRLRNDLYVPGKMEMFVNLTKNSSAIALYNHFVSESFVVVKRTSVFTFIKYQTRDDVKGILDKKDLNDYLIDISTQTGLSASSWEVYSTGYMNYNFMVNTFN